MTTPITLTTAKALGRYRRELLAERLPEELVSDLVRMAASHLLEDSGLGIKAVDE